MENNAFAKLNTVNNFLEDDLSRTVYLARAAYEASGRNKRYSLPFMHIIMEQSYPQLRFNNPNKNIIIYGAETSAYWGKFLAWDIKERGFKDRIKHFWDRNYRSYPDGIDGIPVLCPGEGLNRNEDQVIIASANLWHIMEMRQELVHMAISSEDVFEALDIIGPYKHQYFAHDIITFQEDEVFLDCGSLDFYTSTDFISRCDSVKKIYAFEPIASDELKEHIGKYPGLDIQLVEAAVWHEERHIEFNGQTVGRPGSLVKTVRIDDVIDPNEKVTFIKMDIEGAEQNALKGAARTIARHKPKLALSIYHKPDDMVEIPLFIKSLVPEYKLYVRQYSGTWYETILYAVLE